MVVHRRSAAWSEFSGLAGVILFGAQTLFTLITLPVEFDASARAQQLLVSQGIIRGEQQVEGIEKVLGATAWTYVAGAVSSVGSFFYFAYIVYSMVRQIGRASCR